MPIYVYVSEKGFLAHTHRERTCPSLFLVLSTFREANRYTRSAHLYTHSDLVFGVFYAMFYALNSSCLLSLVHFSWFGSNCIRVSDRDSATHCKLLRVCICVRAHMCVYLCSKASASSVSCVSLCVCTGECLHVKEKNSMAVSSKRSVEVMPTNWQPHVWPPF